MRIEFDPAKDALNTAKHGVSLALAEALNWSTLLGAPDLRKVYGEQRYTGFALLGARLFCVIYVDRDDVRRVISLRKANNREKRRYARNA